MKNNLKSLYHSVILKHSHEPVRFEKKDSATHVIKAYNPVCGDRFEVFFDIENGLLHGVSFHGYGCAISKASTSVLVKKLDGMPVAAALAQCRSFLSLVDPEKDGGMTNDRELSAFTAARDFPGRLKCATLAWEELMDYLMDWRN